MTETQRALALPNSAVLNMAPGANLPAYVQAVSNIAILSVERERELAERLYYEECVDSARELVDNCERQFDALQLSQAEQTQREAFLRGMA